MIIAVDGPTASGKGTIAKALAAHFGLPHLDTGLLYRAVGWQVALNGGDLLTGGGPVATHLDHRIAMSMAIAGLASRDGVEIDDTRPIATSFPAFESLLAGVTR